MNSQKHEQEIKKIMKSGKSKNLKRFIQILLSVSVFSFLFSQSSLVPVFLHYFDQFSPNITLKFFTYKSERNYIFLLCNGILVLIISTSGLITKSHSKSSVPKVDINIVNQQKKNYTYEEPRLQEMQNHAEKSRKNVGFVAEIGDRKKDLQGFDQIEEFVEGEEIEVLSADELNKKCEEFIKKVKQEIQNDFLHLVATRG